MVETSLLKDKETELKHNYVDQQQELTNTIIPNNFEINKDNFSNKKNTEDFLKLCKSEEVTKRNFIYKIQQDFNNFSLKKKPDPIKQKLEYEEYVNQIKQIQTYGKLELDENISIDGEVGPQTRIIIESLQNLNNFSPQVFSNKISAILKQSNSQTREKIKQKLLQQAKESISDDNKEQRETYILTLKKGENVVAEQIYGHLFLDEKILVDGIVGEQTREIQAIIKWGGAITEKGKQREKKYHQHKEKVQQYQERKTDYLKQEPSNTPKSMSETSILDIRGNESLNTFLNAKGEKNPITHENITQRHQEGKKAVITEELQGILSKNQIEQLFDKEGNIKKDAREILHKTFNKNKEDIKKIMKIIHHPNHDKIKQYVQDKIREATQEKAKNLRAINNVLTTVKNYLNVTTIEQKNFWQDFNRNPNNNENLNINEKNITMKGELAGQPKTPIIFSYDMQTGLLSINNICHEKEGILTINANQATTPLFSLSAFNNLKDHNVTFKDVRSEQTDTTVNFQKNTIELHIEKNRTLTYLTENFDIATKTQYDKANSKGIMHLFQILEKSFVKPDEHRLLRKNLQRLNKLIGKEDVKQISTETAEKKAEPHTDDKLLVQQDEKILTDLNSHFNSEKRKTDIKQLNTSDDSSNGIYIFLREFTTNINNKAPTDYNENQKLDLNKMSARLSELEQKQANQNLITYNEKITDEEREEADKTLTDKLNDFPSA